MTEQKLMDITAAAQYLAISKATIYSWVCLKRIPYVKLGRALRFERSELDAFISARKTEARLSP